MTVPVVAGIDMSVNHCGVCVFYADGPVPIFVSDQAKWIPKQLINSVGYVASKELIAHKKKKNKASHYSGRILTWDAFYDELGSLLYASGVREVAIEDYAYSASGTVYQIGEIGGIARARLLRNGLKIRLLSPSVTKKWATGNGVATKSSVIAAISGNEIKNTLSHFCYSCCEPKKDDLDGPGTDIADAYWLAHCLQTELRIRSGDLVMADLTTTQREIFNAVSKHYPENQIVRPFLEG